jgi:hypothetical protein
MKSAAQRQAEYRARDPKRIAANRARYLAMNAARVRILARANRAKHKAKRSLQSREWYQQNRERVLAYNRSKRYPSPVRPEPAQCECCGQRQKARLALDHCHLTGIFRGWLCRMCNTAIGLLRDNPILAVVYLQRAYGGLK